jgi:hypothetical protein
VPLTSAQRRHYLDKISAFRESTDTDVYGDAPAGGAVAVASVQLRPCRLHETSAFDRPAGAPGIQLNQDNLVTADEVWFEIGLDVREHDWLRIDRRTGEEVWYRVAGNPRTIPEANAGATFLLRTNPPEIAP